MKGEAKFKFKQFSVWHHRSAMKVGVDGVLVGCWTDVGDAESILDVGTGCGLIALIMAQRQPEAEITAIDIDLPSVEEASINVRNSQWGDRIGVIYGGFPEGLGSQNDTSRKFDLIISNPPYFNSGVSEVHTARERARHQAELSPSSLLVGSVQLLNPEGSVAMVVPAELSAGLECLAETLGYKLTKKCLVRGHNDAPYKRALLQWKLISNDSPDYQCSNEELTLEIAPGEPTEAYRSLCRDFYLKF